MENKITLHNKLIYLTYGYFILLGIVWITASVSFGGGFSYYGLSLIVIFGAQAYFRKKLVNLLLGIAGLGISIFWSLEFASLGGRIGFGVFVDIMLGICLASLAMSLVLVFSFIRMPLSDKKA